MAPVAHVEGFDAVLGAARAGAEWAWARLYAALAPSVAAYLRAQGATEPEDLTGDVFLHVVAGLERFSGDEAQFRAWVFTIAHRRLVDERRRRTRRPVTAAAPEELERAAGAGGDVHADALAALERDAVRAAIDELPGDQRTVLLLRILGDLTVDDVARLTGKRPGAVKALQRRALRRVERAYPFQTPRR